jgi:hypothetical protein
LVSQSRDSGVLIVDECSGVNVDAALGASKNNGFCLILTSLTLQHSTISETIISRDFERFLYLAQSSSVIVYHSCCCAGPETFFDAFSHLAGIIPKDARQYRAFHRNKSFYFELLLLTKDSLLHRS